jgi:hypothetical protein
VLGRRAERRRGPGARAEVAERQRCRARLVAEPARRQRQPLREQRDVEAKLAGFQVDLLLCRRQEVEQERADPAVDQRPRDELVARALPARAAAVREDDDAKCSFRQREVGGDRIAVDLEANLLLCVNRLPATRGPFCETRKTPDRVRTEGVEPS